MKRIVCLANSRKLNGRCIAGIELGNSGPKTWIRPVSDRPDEEVSEEERRYEDGTDPRVLDIIDIPLIAGCGKNYHTENCRLDPRYYWAKVGTFGWEELSALQDENGPLWVNGFSTNNGTNDRIPLERANALKNSLMLVHIDRLSLKVFAPGEAFGNAKRRVQARFHFDGVYYELWVTDPVVERQYLAKANGEYELHDVYLTVSIGEPHEDYCYKLVAAVIRRT